MKEIIKKPWFLILVILIIASFLRFYHITKLPPGFYPDEAMNANNGIEAWQTGHLQVFYTDNNGREGMWMNIVGFLLVNFGQQPWIPRAGAAVFGLFTVLGVYFFTKELFSKKIALLSSFLIATNFWHINFSRISFRAILSPFFLVWAIYFLLLAFRKIKEQKPAKIYIFNSIISGIFYGLGFHTYIAYRATPALILVILLFYWFQNKEKIFRKKFLISVCCFAITTLIVFAPLILYFIQNPADFFGRTSQISIFSSPNPIKSLAINVIKTAGMFNFVGDSNWRHNLSGSPELFWPVGILFLIGVFVAIKKLIKKSTNQNTNTLPINAKASFWILISWLAIAFAPVVISNEGLPHALRSILMIPPVLILSGIGGIWLYEYLSLKIKYKRIFNIFTFIFLTLLVFESYVAYFILWGQNSNVAGAFNQNYVDIGHQINALPQSVHKYVIVKAGGVEARGIPIPAQTVIFITDTFTSEKQKAKNISYCMPKDNNTFYCLPEQKIINKIPENASQFIIE